MAKKDVWRNFPGRKVEEEGKLKNFVLSMPLGRYGITGDAARAYWYAVKERARANPEVENAAIVTAPPLGGRVYETGYNATPGLRTMSQNVDPEYFDTMKIPLMSGRLWYTATRT